MPAWICRTCAVQHEDTEQPPTSARSASTSASTSGTAVSAGRRCPSCSRPPPTTAARRSRACSASASSRRSRSASGRSWCRRRPETCCGTACRCSTTRRASASTSLGGITAICHVAPALLRRARRLGGRLRRADPHPAGGRAVDPAPVPADRAVRRRGRARARSGDGPHRRPLRRRFGAALAGGLGRSRRAADRRHDHGRPGPGVGQLHVELPQPDPARRGHRARHRARVERLTFDRVYGGWWGAVVVGDGAGAVRRSADRYVARLHGDRP